MTRLDRVLRAFSVTLSIYFLILGLKLHDRVSAGIYLLPGLFWGAYYWIFLREIVKGRELDKSEVTTFLTWFIILIAFTGYTFFMTDSVLHFLGGLVALGASAFFFPFKRMKSIYSKLLSINKTVVLLLFSITGATFLLFIDYPLSISYFITFTAIGLTIYSWNAQIKS